MADRRKDAISLRHLLELESHAVSRDGRDDAGTRVARGASFMKLASVTTAACGR
jgi:hypothetical protein